MIVLDDNKSRYGGNVLQKAYDNGIIMLTLPLHCLQPLDVEFFGLFKTYNNQIADNWMMSHPVIPINIYNISNLIDNGFPKAFTPTNIIKRFKCTGIYLYNNQFFSDAVYYSHLLQIDL